MKIANVKVYDLEESIKASKYPMAVNLNKIDGEITKTTRKLGTSNKGEGHDQFLTGIRVAFDLTFSNKAWVEAERYRFLEFVSSQSTMHRITKFDIRSQCNTYVWDSTIKNLEEKVNEYNETMYILSSYSRNPKILQENVDHYKKHATDLYLEILYNIPSGFQLTARITTNYRALKTIYAQRKEHRLPEWREFCEWILTLPSFNELCIK